MSDPKKPEMLEYEYARSALKNGLKMENELGTNPYKFGMIGSTDSHTGLATAEEDNFFGKHGGSEPSPRRGHILFVMAAKLDYSAGNRLHPDMLEFGRQKIRAKQCSMQWNVAKPMQPPVPGWWSDFSAAGISMRKMRKLACLLK